MKKSIFVLCCLVVLLVSTPMGSQAADGSLANWTAIFNADGSVNDLDGGFDAVFLPDNVSAGIATDMTAFDAANNVVVNGPVACAHDLGNGFVVASKDQAGKLILSAAVERFKSKDDTFIEFEFNQSVMGVSSGNPWPIEGSRSRNDLKVRFIYEAGSLASVEFGVWDGFAFQTQSSSAPAPAGCFVDASLQYEYCNGVAADGLPDANNELWDSNFQAVQVPSADGFVEVKINVGSLMEFSSVTITTPQDIAFGSFQAMGYWAALK